MSGQVNKKELIEQNQNKVISLFKKMQGEFEKALPKHLDADKFIRAATTEFRKTPLLWEADPLTFVGSCMGLAQLGLELGPLGHAYLLPFRNGKTGGVDCNLIIGYKGQIDLARRSGQIISLTAHVVYSKDTFKYAYGLNEVLEHLPALTNRGEMIAVYAVAKLVGGGHQFEVMSVEDVEKIRAKSKAGNFEPWKDSFEEMAKKTAIRRLFKYLPVSVDLQRALNIEDKAEATSLKEVLVEENVIDLDDFWAEADKTESPTAGPTTVTVKTQAEELAAKL